MEWAAMVEEAAQVRAAVVVVVARLAELAALVAMGLSSSFVGKLCLDIFHYLTDR
jgi:hypothetical protein